MMPVFHQKLSINRCYLLIMSRKHCNCANQGLRIDVLIHASWLIIDCEWLVGVRSGVYRRVFASS